MRRLAILLGLLWLGWVPGYFLPGAARAQAVIDPRVFEQLAISPTGEARFLIYLAAQADLQEAEQIQDRAARKTMVASALATTARASQRDLRNLLARLQALGLVSGYRSFFTVNAIGVTGRQAAVEQLAGAPGVVRIEAEDVLTIAGFFVAPASSPQLAVQDNIKQINADDVWRLGFRGQRIVVASIDTGVRWTHEALKPGYRCKLLSSHANCWFDATTDGSVAKPYDDHGHGSHVTGTMAGRRGIGVAKRAKWIACKAFNSSGTATTSDILECSDFFLGLALAAETAVFTPDVINNSWAGGRGSTFFNATIDSWNAAGIHSAFAIGNAGPPCQTSQGPGEYTQAFGVGAVNSADTVASFSGRGKASSANGGTIKPDVVAPGVSIRSASAACNTCYAFFSGTSMATPHVVGELALMLSKSIGLTPAKARSIVEATGRKISNLACGGTASDNNVYGRGRIDALAAINATP